MDRRISNVRAQGRCNDLLPSRTLLPFNYYVETRQKNYPVLARLGSGGRIYVRRSSRARTPKLAATAADPRRAAAR